MYPTRRRLLGLGAGLLALPAIAATSTSPAAAGASRELRIIEEGRVGPRLLDLAVESPALGRAVGVRLLTPRGWDGRRPGTRWPVLYLLHAGFEPRPYRTWTEETGVAAWPELLDVLVVMPEGGTVGFYADWWNHGAGGPPAWETFHLRELRPLLEDGHGAGTCRATAGLSMGGHGALTYAARHPKLFRAAASFSGPAHLLHPANQREGWPQLIQAAAQFGYDLNALWGAPEAQRPIWEAHDPYHLADRLRHTSLYLSCGDGNPGPLAPESPPDPAEALLRQLNESLVDRLTDLGLRPVTHFHTGTHHPAYGERELRSALPLLLCALRL